MAATSVLEPMVLLYRLTGRRTLPRLLRAMWSKSWDEAERPEDRAVTVEGEAGQQDRQRQGVRDAVEPRGPLRTGAGHRRPVVCCEPVLIAWQDIVDKRLYLTGSASQGEHFRDDHELPNHPVAHVGETCVTTTWIQLNSQLLRLTGEAQVRRRTGTNVVQPPRCRTASAMASQWCYFTALEGTKPYGPGINCCVSSGPRGMALVPQHALFLIRGSDTEAERLFVNLYGMWRFSGNVGQTPVLIEQKSNFPQSGRCRLLITAEQPVRVCASFSATRMESEAERDGQ